MVRRSERTMRSHPAAGDASQAQHAVINDEQSQFDRNAGRTRHQGHTILRIPIVQLEASSNSTAPKTIPSRATKPEQRPAANRDHTHPPIPDAKNNTRSPSIFHAVPLALALLPWDWDAAAHVQPAAVERISFGDTGDLEVQADAWDAKEECRWTGTQAGPLGDARDMEQAKTGRDWDVSGRVQWRDQKEEEDCVGDAGHIYREHAKVKESKNQSSNYHVCPSTTTPDSS
ncbi:hypothetical protein BKA81DRAFT_382405 [Phyllosticta paracitricarpa]|uniref:Uncharacterized protein n=1 Tax=Phyllosticta citricarpa TaxID=55181 RepID=A0ABR1LTT2_9PEZI